MQLLLIDVSWAAPALREHFERYPDEMDAPQTREQMREMCRLAVRYMRVRKTLSDYAEAAAGKPCKN